jgi:L-alanine-DL-glutamate epimerase-like enolase superfamily enzyme
MAADHDIGCTAVDRLWTRLAELPLTIGSIAYERLSAMAANDFQRITTVVHLAGGGEEGLGEDVSVFRDEANSLHVLEPDLGLAGEWTLGAFCDHLHATDQWPIAPEYDVARRWRNWAFESAALDLALRQAGQPLHAVLGREPRPLRFVNSLGLGEPPSFDPIRRRLDAHPDVHFKLDAHPAWTPELIDALVATGSVDIVDFKGHYGMEVEDPEALRALYDYVIRAFPDALVEDAHDLPEITERLRGEEGRISYDSPIATPEDLDRVPLRPRAVNIKPCRVGDLRTLMGLYAEVDARGLIVYGGGMGELGAGRGQIQLLASIFHPDGPNDTAPSGYNAEIPAADLPDSPLPPRATATGFRRE